MITIIPLNGNVLIEKEIKETKLASGMILPEDPSNAPDVATVIAVSQPYISSIDKRQELTHSEKTVVNSNLTVGDQILYKQWGLTEVKLEDKSYFLIKETDILAIIKKDDSKA
jgi:chaperonin GroES